MDLVHVGKYTKKEGSKMNDKIDFVILWVDGSDPKWLKEKQKYNPSIDVDDAANRYRDWDNLRYWFRGVEKFAPWVNKIHFVTWGHLPEWLDTTNPKLNIVNHKDICEKKYLPLYNSNAIEMNINKIKDLSEKFVYFNDDMFIIDSTKKEDFFYKNKPCDEYAETPIEANGKDEIFAHTLLNNMTIINKRYSKKSFFKTNKKLYLSLKYGKNLIRTITQLPYKHFTGIYNPHIPQSFKKKYFDELWKNETEKVEETLNNRFRSKTDITQYVVRYFQLLEGDFYPRKSSFGKIFEISQDNTNLVKHIKKQKSKVICLNDTDENIEFEKSKEEINNAFEKILGAKSSFEK